MTEGHGDDAYRYPDIRMNFSSNIYAHADMTELKAHLCSCISLIDSYPEPEPRALEAMIASRHGIGADCVLVTAGVTDAIYLIAQELSRRASYYRLATLPTFSEYEDACRMYGLRPAPQGAPPLGVVSWLCTPNNPTGAVCAREDVVAAARQCACLVVDQSYEDYTEAPVLTHREAVQAGNIIQLHSLTKSYAIPGLRVGYVVASPALVSALRGGVRPWSVNALAIEAGKWLMDHAAAKAVAHLPAYLAEAQRLRQRLNGIPGIHAGATSTGFMLVSVAPMTAAALKERLARQHHILIRDASNFRGLTPHHFRVSTQAPHENDCLVEAIGQCIGHREEP